MVSFHGNKNIMKLLKCLETFLHWRRDAHVVSGNQRRSFTDILMVDALIQIYIPWRTSLPCRYVVEPIRPQQLKEIWHATIFENIQRFSCGFSTLGHTFSDNGELGTSKAIILSKAKTRAIAATIMVYFLFYFCVCFMILLLPKQIHA